MKLVEAGAFPKEVVGDEAVLETLEEWYSRRPSLADVQITVWEGIAILRGRVTTLRDRQLAIELALDAGADEVLDELTLRWPVAAQEEAKSKFHYVDDTRVLVAELSMRNTFARTLLRHWPVSV